MGTTFGISEWIFRTFQPDGMRNMTYHGRPARFSFRVARTQHKLGGVEIELIEPIDGDNIFRDHLEERGEGFHHVGWYRVDSVADFTAATRALEKTGFPCLMSAQCDDIAIAYMDTNRVLKTILEVIWVLPAKEG
jgi:methylmalonyl-CoA/ethylmalonyl-CoA epimerase